MKPHPRIRKTIKWSGAAVTVLLVVVWIGSAWRFAVWYGPGRWSVSLDGGAILFGPNTNRVTAVGGGGGLTGVLLGKLVDRVFPPPPVRRGLFSGSGRHSIFWLPSWGTAPASGWWVNAPLWPVILLSLATTSLLWSRNRRASRSGKGHCEGCGYDRAGLAIDAKCPECGAAAGGV